MLRRSKSGPKAGGGGCQNVSLYLVLSSPILALINSAIDVEHSVDEGFRFAELKFDFNRGCFISEILGPEMTSSDYGSP